MFAFKRELLNLTSFDEMQLLPKNDLFWKIIWFRWFNWKQKALF